MLRKAVGERVRGKLHSARQCKWVTFGVAVWAVFFSVKWVPLAQAAASATLEVRAVVAQTKEFSQSLAENSVIVVKEGSLSGGVVRGTVRLFWGNAQPYSTEHVRLDLYSSSLVLVATAPLRITAAGEGEFALTIPDVQGQIFSLWASITSLSYPVVLEDVPTLVGTENSSWPPFREQFTGVGPSWQFLGSDLKMDILPKARPRPIMDREQGSLMSVILPKERTGVG